MSFTLSEVAGVGLTVLYDGKEVIVVPTTEAKKMKLLSGEWMAKEKREEMPGNTISKNGLWVLRTAKYGSIYAARPWREADGTWSRTGLIRSFCWGLFSRVTGIRLSLNECRMYELVQGGVCNG